MQNIDNIISTIVVFAAFAIVIIAILNFILRMRILQLGYKDETYIKLLSKSIEYKESALKWAILLFFGGLGLIVINYLSGPAGYESPLPYGIEAVFLAAGFMVYYLVARKDNKNS
jgi:hypothetical protein